MDRRKRDREGAADAEGGGRTDSESTSFDDGSFRKPESGGALGSGAAMDFSSESAGVGDTFKKNVTGERKVRAKVVVDSPKPGSAHSVEVEVDRPRGSVRPSGGKDRHSKVQTSKGLRDRRVRLSVATAIQFYDVQDRLGYDQPSKAVEWLLKKAKAAIDDLPPVPSAVDRASGGAHGGAFSPALSVKSGPAIPRFYPQAIGLSPGSSSFREPERQEEQKLQEPFLESPSAKEGGDGGKGGVARLESRVKARERARERMKEKTTTTTGRDPSSPSHSPEAQSFIASSMPHSAPMIPFDSSALNVPESFTSLLQNPHVPFQNLAPPSQSYQGQFLGQLGFQQALLSLEQVPSRQFHPAFPGFASLPLATTPLDLSFFSNPVTSPGHFSPQLSAAAAAPILSSNPLPSDPFVPSSPQFRPFSLLEEPPPSSYFQGLLRPQHSFTSLSPLQSEPFPASPQQAHHFGSLLDRNVSGPREPSSSSSRFHPPASYYQSGSQQQFPAVIHGIGGDDEIVELNKDDDGGGGGHHRSSSIPRARPP
ncbi:uncharacterized protein LOC112343562 [Selaginella moellendorffii]|nr:uncharacterized protein LOC112343562 [Selaginella moellendorffii]XP_024522991.1 uncharacterized protein LOC112343562 [Selaginella moellendorffii]XP_024522992.1 uncharacterized protein LOC112343562 [Selaginella moellendorffii]XP_024522993.1 uncharacterized protein LOC112343562 [Selaginella moellendorffii]|eukprot:XP_024522990.1 uncharacterized protein LOC112343562 [Selaginella moellendorffii]